MAHLPIDSQHQLVASAHIYPNNPCNASECWSQTLAAVARAHPVVAGELGEFDCEHAFIDEFMKWADANGVSYLGWSWNTYDCAAGPSLIASADGTPTAFGEGLHTHLQATSPSIVNEPPPETPPVREEPPTPPSTPNPQTPPPILTPPAANPSAPNPPAANSPPLPPPPSSPAPSRHKSTRKHKVKKHRTQRGASRIAAQHRFHRQVTKTLGMPAKKSAS
jgi:hypothetical protein